MQNRFIVALFGALVIAGVVQHGSAQSEDPTPDSNLFAYNDAATVALGADLYVDFCAACHGADLQGQENWQIRQANGRLPAPPHDVTGHTWHHPDAQLFQIVKFGTAALVGNGYESDMIGYGDILTDDEIRAVMAYIKSTWPIQIIERHNAMNADVSGQ